MSSKRINCWEYMKCGRSPENQKRTQCKKCPATMETSFNGMNEGLNAGRSCWLVAGTFCDGETSGTFAEKIKTCKDCEFYKDVHTNADQTSLGIKNIDIVAATHIGHVKLSNEDRYLIRSMDDKALLLAVADGLGGDVSSDVAAEIAKGKLAGLKYLNKGKETEELDTFTRTLDLIIHKKAQTHSSLTYMATTLACTVLKSDMIHWVNAGDSRFYILRGSQLIQVTKDHTLARVLVEEGSLKAEEADGHYSSKILDQCLGYGMCEPETGSIRVKKNDLLMLSTDGLHKMVTKNVILKILRKSTNLEEKIKALMSAALISGGKDNITVVLAHIKQTLL